MRAEIRVALHANPYTGVVRSCDSIDRRFTNEQLVRELPESASELKRYLAVLEDQALVARAEGNVRRAAAIGMRVKRLQKLVVLLDEIRTTDSDS